MEKVLAPGCPEPVDKGTWPGPMPGSEPCTLGWLPLLPPRRERWERRTQEPNPPLPRLWAAASLAKPSLPDWTGLGPAGELQPALPVVPVCFCLHPGPTIIYNISIPWHHMAPNQTEMGRRQQGDKIEGGLSYAIFQSPLTYSGAKRTIYLTNKRNRRSKLVFTVILTVTGGSLMGILHMGTVGAFTKPAQINPKMLE